MTAHHNHWDTSATRDETSRNISSTTTTTTTTESPKVVRQLEMMNKNFVEMMRQIQTIKSVDTKCEYCGGPHSFTECPAAYGYTQEAAYAITSNHNLGGDVKAITTQSGVAYDGPSIPLTPSSLPKEVKRETEVTKDKVQNTSLGSTAHVQPPVVQDPIPEPEVAPKPKPKPSIPYPSRLNDQKLHEKDDNLASKFVEIFQELHFRGCSSTYAEICFNIVECLALANLGASINLMPLSIWKKLSHPELTPTRMILELADRSTTIDDEAITFKVGQTSRYSYNNAKSVNRIDVIDVSCEEYAQEVLGFSDSSTNGNPTPSLDLIISTSFPSLTPFEGGDFILKEIEACLTNDSIPPGIDDADFDPKGDLLLLEKLLNNDPSSPLSPKELNFEELKTIKSSIDDPPELKLKDLPSHLEYAFLEGTDKLPVIMVIYKELKDEEKAALLKVLKSHKRAIAWKISDIKGVNPRFCTHKILMEDNFKPAVQHQRKVNPKIHEVIKKEVIKLLDAGLIYPIFDSPWVSPVHCVPKKGGMTVVKNEDNELIPTRLVTG
ncbi:hypothetical protein Tco_1045658 [Tanacetum coccineum]|uniref:Reverse transcriptase domain-containing protein n=1 Tax=Tanacetum coccineum TaxID=301880 RepID=A0ABQ5GTR5_9ASTR